MDFKIVYYKDSASNDPIHEFLLELARSNPDLFTQAIKGIEKLRNRAYHREPLSKHIAPELWELRVRAGSGILRILYVFAKGQVIILLHAFVKKQQKTPTSELEMARKRLKYLKGREII